MFKILAPCRLLVKLISNRSNLLTYMNFKSSFLLYVCRQVSTTTCALGGTTASSTKSDERTVRLVEYESVCRQGWISEVISSNNQNTIKPYIEQSLCRELQVSHVSSFLRKATLLRVNRRELVLRKAAIKQKDRVLEIRSAALFSERSSHKQKLLWKGKRSDSTVLLTPRSPCSHYERGPFSLPCILRWRE